MFDKFKNWIRTVRTMSLPEGQLPPAAGVETAVSPEMGRALALWCDIYEGRAPWLSGQVKSLGLGAAIASELARMTTIELRSGVSASGAGSKKRAEFLDGCYQRLLPRLRGAVEYGCAMGTLVFKPYVRGGKIGVDTVCPDAFIPTAFDSEGTMTDVVFIDRAHRDGKFYTRLEAHSLQGGTLRITNTAYVSSAPGVLGRPASLDALPEWAGLAPEAEVSGVDRPLYSCFTVPQANTVDRESPMGTSVFARATGLMEEADRQYSRLLWEFESGERALFVDETAFKHDEDGRVRLPDKRLYRLLDSGEDGFFHDWTPSMRDANILNGLNALLMKIEDVCGLARGTFSEVGSEAKTATELKILRQRSYATVTDLQKSLQHALEDLVAAMDVYATIYGLAPQGGYETSFEFDDSTVADREREFVEKQELVAAGIMQPWEFRMWYFGETEQIAKAATQEATEAAEESEQEAPAAGASED